MYLDVYIGDLDDGGMVWDESKWNQGTWSGNAPYRQSPFFPFAGAGPFWAVVRKIDNKEFEGKQVDWGGWVAKVTKKQIQDFLDEQYKNDENYRKVRDKDINGILSASSYSQGWIGVFLELIDFVAALDDGKKYALTASEL